MSSNNISSTTPARKQDIHLRSSTSTPNSAATTTAAVKESFAEAVKANDVESVKSLLTSHRGMINLNNLEKDEIYSHLMSAALNGSLEVTKVLVEQGRADPNIQNKVNRMLFFCFLSKSQIQCNSFSVLLIFLYV
jgi:hypothetical protein